MKLKLYASFDTGAELLCEGEFEDVYLILEKLIEIFPAEGIKPGTIVKLRALAGQEVSLVLYVCRSSMDKLVEKLNRVLRCCVSFFCKTWVWCRCICPPE